MSLKEAFARSIVDEPRFYGGVDLRHPRRLEAIRTLVQLGKTNEEICRVVGIPQEVVDRVRREVKQKSSTDR